MDKRRFLVTSGLASLVPVGSVLAQAMPDQRPPAASDGRQPGVLTITGAIGRTNRGPFDPALDQMMGKHGVKFDKAYVMDAAMLQRLPAVDIRPTLEYDDKAHALSGPLMSTVLAEAQVELKKTTRLALRAVDGYNVEISGADALAYRMIVAVRLDGRPMPLGGLGPQWAIYDADSLPAFKDKPVNQRFALCPWALYHIDVAA